MLTDFKENKHYIDYFFKNHRLFFCDSLPWEFYNYENGKVVYNALGHDSSSLLKPEMVNIIKKSVKWVSGDKDA